MEAQIKLIIILLWTTTHFIAIIRERKRFMWNKKGFPLRQYVGKHNRRCNLANIIYDGEIIPEINSNGFPIKTVQ